MDKVILVDFGGTRELAGFFARGGDRCVVFAVQKIVQPVGKIRKAFREGFLQLGEINKRERCGLASGLAGAHINEIVDNLFAEFGGRQGGIG